MVTGLLGVLGQHAQNLVAMELNLTPELVQILRPLGEEKLVLELLKKLLIATQISAQLVSFQNEWLLENTFQVSTQLFFEK